MSSDKPTLFDIRYGKTDKYRVTITDEELAALLEAGLVTIKPDLGTRGGPKEILKFLADRPDLVKEAKALNITELNEGEAADVLAEQGEARWQPKSD